MATTNSFGARSTLSVDGKSYTIFKLEALEKRGFSLARMPYSIKVMIENLLRREDGLVVTTGQIEALAKWSGKGVSARSRSCRRASCCRILPECRWLPIWR